MKFPGGFDLLSSRDDWKYVAGVAAAAVGGYVIYKIATISP
jgi:hypothetical protein